MIGSAADVTIWQHGFMAGPRLIVSPAADVAIFGHMLLGAVHSRFSFAGTAESTDFAIQSGGGVDVWVTRRFGVRAGADYRRIA